MKEKSGITISGRVIHGDHVGRMLGFPTANIDRRNYNRQGLELKWGVYAGYVLVNQGLRMHGQKYRSAIVIGPLDKKGLPKLEAHLLGFTGSLYGKQLIFEIGKYIRPWKKITDMAALRQQIQKDIQRIKARSYYVYRNY